MRGSAREPCTGLPAVRARRPRASRFQAWCNTVAFRPVVFMAALGRKRPSVIARVSSTASIGQFSVSEIETPPLPSLSELVIAAVHESVTCSDALYALHPGQCGKSRRDNLAAAYLSLCLDHREAIVLLARHGSASSAFALARAVYETCVRRLWTLFSASDDQQNQQNQLIRGIAPSFETVGKELAKSVVAAGKRS